MLRIGIIGKRGHARRLIDLLRKRRDARLAVVYTPHAPGAEETGLPYSQTFSDLLPCDAVIIASPTPTHAAYLERLKKYRGYILLEKPAVSTLAQTKPLRRWSTARKSRVQVNFNVPFGPLAKILSQLLRDRRMGQILAFDVHTSHGLAFKKKYRQSWRSRKGASVGVLETVGVHYVHLALHLFGKIKTSHPALRRVAGKSGPADLGTLRLQHAQGAWTTLRHSYAAPLINRMFLLGTNGYWEYDGEKARLYSPRDTFDASGLFASPPICKRWTLNALEADRDSWAGSLNHFLNVAARKGRFPARDFDLALSSMEPLFALRPT